MIKCGTHTSVWKDCTCSQTSMCQTTVRGELFRDFMWSDVKHIYTHGPETHDGNSTYPMMGFIEQDYRKEVSNTKKKSDERGGIKSGCNVLLG